MVRVFYEDLLKGIALTKTRIKHLEKHGNGSSAMQEKVLLKNQERKLELWKEKNK